MRIIIILSIMFSAFLLGSCISTNTNQKTKQEVNSNSTDLITIVQLAKSEKATVVDVRTDEEYADGHIPNSVHIPLASVADSLDKFKPYKKIILVCGSGKRAEKAKAILNENGYDNIYNGKGWAEFNELLKK